ncbi:aldehyde dehydrogenase (NADP(+)) [Actinobacteria bacterium YIM 96077]|uniref:Aldehyde dehydrogenase (NADP(+)) n=1 Tax=Phytoactinopolyspora halophila TaxID=1981511 RepID=A0A329QET5_9ACTN|nr:aldehyde dehydrogenase (NADP(+)) [Phytoactinopolyspora halophila]AYY14068.1 aldehyde dehydrogenase (NADP(+)) [Actinobacteria bacterium YIM 96077]RAW10975.1 aldehyde dehydrogenase (NADP(+)) [Phytoactinopolyspora halophila]
MTTVVSIDPRTGSAGGAVAEETAAEQVDWICQQAQTAFPALEAMGRAGRAAMLRAMADALEAERERIVATGDRETALGEGRLGNELTRTCYQLRLFAEVLDEGSYVEAMIDHAGDTPMGPRPDIRRMLVPTGPVAVFGASNFPLAFSVPGGDTASALAAGCPVVVKAHGSHPETSVICGEILQRAARESGAPEGTVSLVHGLDAGAALVAHPVIRAVGFTGSLSGGRALMDIINRRPEPIPFYGEMSSLNPLVVTHDAASERPDEIGRGIVGSATLGSGQFCTKPGLVFVPAGADGDAVVESMRVALRELGPQWMLNEGIATSYRAGIERLGSVEGTEVVALDAELPAQGFATIPQLVFTDAAGLEPEVTEECFGPVTVVARYRDVDELTSALASLPASLTASVHTGRDETELPERAVHVLRDKAGRFIYNGFPTGVAVTWAQQHGGPWPSTNTLHTSVGPTAVRRFLRPVAWQNAPEPALPEELRDAGPGIPRRVDGQLVLP